MRNSTDLKTVVMKIIVDRAIILDQCDMGGTDRWSAE
jgi:hypothetical protein